MTVIAATTFAAGAWWVARDLEGLRSSESPPATESLDGPVWFVESAESSGLRFRYVPGSVIRYWFPEITGGGAALFDYDADDDLDLYLVQGGDLDPEVSDKPGNQLYRNRGDGTFEDVTAAAGVGDTGYGMGCASGDYDGDGDIDLYVTNVRCNVLYRNNGDGTFTNVTAAAGVGDTRWGTSCAFVDYDADGDLDLFVVNYVSWSSQTEILCGADASRRDYCSPLSYSPAPDTLYRNEGDGTFVEVSQAAGMWQAFGNGLGICHGDFNSDGRMDFYVANDANPNQLWINDGNGGFTNEALLSGCSVNMQGAAEAGMGATSVDIDNDGDLDLFMTHLHNETNTLYVNDGGFFDDATATVGLSMVSVPYTGFGTGFADFDHDQALDLYIANGGVSRQAITWVPSDPYAEPNLLFAGRSDGRFVPVSPSGGTREPLIGNSRGTAFGDVDNDGDVDVVVVELGGPVRLLRNVAGSRGAWIMFRVRNKWGIDAVGAVVEIEAGQRRQFRQVQTAFSYCVSNDPRVHFGLGTVDRVAQVRVRWAGGAEERFGAFVGGQVHELREGAGQPVTGVGRRFETRFAGRTELPGEAHVETRRDR